MFGYTTGLSLIYKFNRRFSLETGILYSNKGYKIKDDELMYSSTGQDIPDSKIPTKMKILYNHYYLDIPFKINYLIVKSNLSYYLTAGASASVFIKGTRTRILEYKNGENDKKTYLSEYDFLNYNYAVLFGFGMEYDILKRLEIKIEPIFRRSLTPDIDLKVKRYLYSFGVNIGFVIK